MTSSAWDRPYRDAGPSFQGRCEISLEAAAEGECETRDTPWARDDQTDEIIAILLGIGLGVALVGGAIIAVPIVASAGTTAVAAWEAGGLVGLCVAYCQRLQTLGSVATTLSGSEPNIVPAAPASRASLVVLASDDVDLFIGPGAASRTEFGPTVGDLRSAGMTDAHHIIQDAAMRGVPGYRTNEAPGVELAEGRRQSGLPTILLRRLRRRHGRAVLTGWSVRSPPMPCGQRACRNRRWRWRSQEPTRTSLTRSALPTSPPVAFQGIGAAHDSDGGRRADRRGSDRSRPVHGCRKDHAGPRNDSR